MLSQHHLLFLVTAQKHLGCECSVQDGHHYPHIDPKWLHKEASIMADISRQIVGNDVPESLIPENHVDRGAIDDGACIARVEKESVWPVFHQPMTWPNGQLVL